jgi:hypothetical protein
LRDEFHKRTDGFFYITAGDIVHVFVIRPYGLLYRNHGVRTISQNFVGTYSGIFYKGKKLRNPAPMFAGVYIREINGIAFFCYSTLFVSEMQNGDSLSNIREMILFK